MIIETIPDFIPLFGEARNENEKVAKRANFSIGSKKGEHSFKHLLNVHFKVKQLKLPEVFSTDRPQRNYAITEAEKIKIALRHAENAKTTFDD